MIDLGTLKIAKVSAVPLGDLVLYAHDTRLLFAVRVAIEGGDAHERIGLLMLCINVVGPRPEPVIFSEVGNDSCLHIGKPMVAWEGDAGSLAEVEGSLRERPPLVLVPEGLALTGRMSRGLDKVGAWGLPSGTPLQIRHGFFVSKWQIGVVGLDGKFCALVKYPDDYAPKAS